MVCSKFRLSLFLLGLALAGMRPAVALDITWFQPTDTTNSNANVTVNAAYTTNFGVAFTTGSASTFKMDWVKLILNTSNYTSGSGSFKLSLRNTTNTTAYSAAAGATELAVDTVNFTMPTTTATPFSLDLRAADIPNITNYTMAASTSYSLIIYNASAAFAIERHSGYAQNTTNNFYTVSNGFTALNTFRNNNTYSNNPSSFPSLPFSFGNTVAVPEPSTWAMCGLCTLVLGGLARRKKAVTV